MRQLDAEPTRSTENRLAGADIDLAVVDRESLGGRIVAVAARFRFVAIAHCADLTNVPAVWSVHPENTLTRTATDSAPPGLIRKSTHRASAPTAHRGAPHSTGLWP